jgi:hypothetical protein
MDEVLDFSSWRFSGRPEGPQEFPIAGVIAVHVNNMKNHGRQKWSTPTAIAYTDLKHSLQKGRALNHYG